MAETPPLAANAGKGSEVEEWVDLHFFRPLGARIARWLYPTRTSPDTVTVWSLVIGVVAALCFRHVRLAWNVAGFALFIVSDIFDSADGQLARMRGTSTRVGRLLDGFSDTLRFTTLYVSLVLRMVTSGWHLAGALVLAAAAGISHSWQSAAVDFIRNAYLRLAAGRGELDLPEDVNRAAAAGTAARPGIVTSVGTWMYRRYVQRQILLFPRTVALVRRLRETGAPETALAPAYRARQAPIVRNCAWLGQNIRWLLIGLAGASGWAAGFLWVTFVPLNLVMLVLVWQHEHHAAALDGSLGGFPPTDTATPAHAV